MDLAIPKSNQQGFVLVFFLTLLPVIIIALSLMTVILLHLQTQNDIRHSCRKKLFTAQQSVAQNLSVLMGLNPLARSLRLQLRLAYLKLAVVAANPGAEAAVLAQIAKIQQQQIALDEKQKALLTQSEFALRSGQIQSELAVSSAAREKSRYYDRLLYLSLSGVRSRAVHLAVRPDSPGDIAPIYELEPDFKAKQSLQTFWKVEYSWINSSWIQKSLHWRRIVVSDSCRSSIEEKTDQFRAVLNEDRFLSRP
jgi:hypothetical protein